jgi:hypothetical protein
MTVIAAAYNPLSHDYAIAGDTMSASKSLVHYKGTKLLVIPDVGTAGLAGRGPIIYRARKALLSPGKEACWTGGTAEDVEDVLHNVWLDVFGNDCVTKKEKDEGRIPLQILLSCPAGLFEVHGGGSVCHVHGNDNPYIHAIGSGGPSALGAMWQYARTYTGPATYNDLADLCEVGIEAACRFAPGCGRLSEG